MSASTEDQSTALNTAPPTYDTVTSPPTKYQVTILDEHSRSGVFLKMGSYTDIDTGFGTGRIASAFHLHPYSDRDGSDPRKPDQYIQLTKVSDVCPVEVKVVETQTPNGDQPTDIDRRSSKIMRGSRNQIDLVIPFNFHPESYNSNADGEGDGDGSRGSSIFDSFALTGFTNSIKDVQELNEWKERAQFDLITNHDMTNSEVIPMVLGDVLNSVPITGLNLDLYKGEDKIKSLENLDGTVNGMTFFCGMISEGSVDQMISETEGGTAKITTEATQDDQDGITKDLDKLSVSQ
ncbi:uncharacterized protein L199_003540 [Kwoniella botswanensis]|uniref:uncharacterized protein n=1 Tax=Kwoniella botswanensis TaxID=1268659 RepID=UPI00315C660A